MRGSFEDLAKSRAKKQAIKKIEKPTSEEVVEEKDFNTINKILELSLDKILRIAKNGISAEQLASLFEELKSDVKLAEKSLMHSVNEEVKEEYEVRVETNFGQVLYGPPPADEVYEVHVEENYGQVLYGPPVVDEVYEVLVEENYGQVLYGPPPKTK